MPELPEVETIVRGLRTGDSGRPALPGMMVERVSVRWPGHIAEPSVPVFKRRVRGQVIRDVSRRGKFVVIPLDRETLLIHLRMSGDLQVAPTAAAPDRYAHTVFHLSEGWDLRFSDARKFGRVYLAQDPQSVLGTLGPEPLDPDFTPAVLSLRLRNHRRTLKPLLLDQTFIAGLGNIYADEALHRACLHPLRRSDSLRREEAERLWQGIREALQTGLQHNGASIDWVFRGGDFQNHFRVYQRTGEPCPICGSSIARIVLGQRGTHFCPSCQPEVES